MYIKVKCKNCDWEGQEAVGKKGHKLSEYKCPKCGGDIKKGKGRNNYRNEYAVLKKERS
ncbi:hypothetical protein ES705_14088 [subsurface metagenome]